MALPAGRGLGLVREIRPAGEIMRELAEGRVGSSSGVLVRTVVGRPQSSSS